MLQGLDEQTALIYEPIKIELGESDQSLRKLAADGGSDITDLLDYVLKTHGKRVRPAMTLLSAKIYPHTHNHPIIMATAVELLHIATLIHDDTIDNSDLRHGKATVSSNWGKNVAVLLGDYVFATSATFVCDTNNVRVIRRFSETIMELASGELMEYLHAFSPNQTLEQYEERIYKKTASLFRTACETGAILGGSSEEHVQALLQYGYNIGMAFQIIDDVLDVQGDPDEIGKPVGNDLLQGVITLPAIYLMEKYPGNNPIKSLFKDISQTKHLDKALDMIQNSNIIPECQVTAHKYYERAIQSLNTVPPSIYRTSLEELAAYMIDRKY